MTEQMEAFAKDKLDPKIAKMADKVVDLLVQKKETDDALKLWKKNLIKALHEHKKSMIRHHGMEIRVKVVSQKEELTIKQLKPVDGQKPKRRRVP